MTPLTKKTVKIRIYLLAIFIWQCNAIWSTENKLATKAIPDESGTQADSLLLAINSYYANPYNRNNKLETRAEAFLQLSDLYRTNYDFTRSIETALRALSNYKAINNFEGVVRCFIRIGVNFEDLKNYTKAKRYYEFALNIAQNAKLDRYAADCYNNLAGIEYHQKNYLKSVDYFAALFERLQALGLEKRLAQAKMNCSVVLMEIDPQQALTMLNEAKMYFDRQPYNSEIEAGMAGNFGAIYFRLGKTEEALKMYNQSLKVSEMSGLQLYTLTNYKDLEAIYESIGDYKNAYLNYYRYDSLEALVISETERDKATQLEFNYQMELKNQKTKNLALKFEKNELEKKELLYLFWLVVSLFFIALLTAISIYIVLKARSHGLKQKKELLLIKNKIIGERLTQSLTTVENLQNELEMNKEDLINFSIDIERKNEIHTKLYEGIKSLKRFALGDKAMLATLQELIFLSATSVKLNSENELKTNQLDKLNHAFFQSLTAQFPKLTTNEKKLCGLIRIKTGIQEIASIRGISPKSVEMSRYRLKKKMGLSEQQNLDQFIENM